MSDKPISFLLYNLPDSDGQVQAVVQDETIWLTQKAMAELFGVQVPAISKHLRNIFDEGELSRDTTISKMETVVNRSFRGEVSQLVEFYNLDAIISVGYRVNSAKATRFRQWATRDLNEFLAFRRYRILPDKGRISAAQARKKAHQEYDIFNKTQLIDSDFDKATRKILGSNDK